MAVILPFEEAFYRQRGMKVDYVGHPLMDDCPQEMNKEQAMTQLGLDQGYPVVGLLPGSRKEEIGNLLPVMVDAAELLGRCYPGLQCVLPLAPTIEREFIQSFISKSSVRIKVFRGNVYEALSTCDVALVASGTATLETAIMGVPMVIAYRVSPVTYWAARIMVKVPNISLVNLLAGEEVAPELIQGELAPLRLAHEAVAFLEDREVRGEIIKKLKGITEGLGRGGTSKRTAEIAFEIMTKE